MATNGADALAGSKPSFLSRNGSIDPTRLPHSTTPTRLSATASASSSAIPSLPDAYQALPLLAVGDGDGQTHATEHRKVHDIIAYVTYFLIPHTGDAQNFFVGLNLFQRVFLDEVQAQFLGAVLDHR